MKDEKILCPYCREDVPMEMAMSGTHMHCPRCHSTSPLIRDLHTAALTPEDVVRHAAMSRHREAVKDGDLISRAALLKEIRLQKSYAGDMRQQTYRTGFIVSLSMLEGKIANMPTVDAEPVRHGRWLKTCLPDVFACSECRKPTKMDELCSSRTLRDYCPNCGAKMDAEVEE